MQLQIAMNIFYYLIVHSLFSSLETDAQRVYDLMMQSPTLFA